MFGFLFFWKFGFVFVVHCGWLFNVFLWAWMICYVFYNVGLVFDVCITLDKVLSVLFCFFAFFLEHQYNLLNIYVFFEKQSTCYCLMFWTKHFILKKNDTCAWTPSLEVMGCAGLGWLAPGIAPGIVQYLVNSIFLQNT